MVPRRIRRCWAWSGKAPMPSTKPLLLNDERVQEFSGRRELQCGRRSVSVPRGSRACESSRGWVRPRRIGWFRRCRPRRSAATQPRTRSWPRGYWLLRRWSVLSPSSVFGRSRWTRELSRILRDHRNANDGLVVVLDAGLSANDGLVIVRCRDVLVASLSGGFVPVVRAWSIRMDVGALQDTEGPSECK